MIVGELNSDNIIVNTMVLPDEAFNNLNDYINNVLNVSGVWVKLPENWGYLKDRHPSIGCKYDYHNDVFIDAQPFPSWTLDKNFNWQPPKPLILRDPLQYKFEPGESRAASFYWDEDRLEWGHSWIFDLFDKENTRNGGIFVVHKTMATEVQKVNDFHGYINVVCNPDADGFVSIHPDWEPGYVDHIFAEGGAASKFWRNDGEKNYVFQDYFRIYSGIPYFRVFYTELVDLHEEENEIGLREPNKEFEKLYLDRHPQLAGRSLGELFRLIIDWDQAYHHFENRENIAILAHDVMSTIQMPDSIYNQLVDQIPGSPVTRYLQGDQDALNLPEPRPTTPPDVLQWFKDKYWDLRDLRDISTLNIREYIDNHYYI